MFAIIQRVNTISGAMQNLTVQVQSLSDTVAKLPSPSSSSQVQNERSATERALAELKSQVEAVVADVAKLRDTGREELKQQIVRDLAKEVSKEIAKECKLMETSVLLKLEQTANKMMKERMDKLSTELKQYVDKATESAKENAYRDAEVALQGEGQGQGDGSADDETEDYEINVTLAGEKEETAPKRAPRKPRKKTTPPSVDA